MKKAYIFLVIILLLTFLLPFPTFSKDRVISNSEIPNEIKEYISLHFPSETISKAEIEEEGISYEYEIKLNNRTKLVFDSNNKIIKIDSKREALPNSVIPKQILSYVQANYPKNKITEWEIEWQHQEVSLDNSLELEFTLEGDFIRIDD